MNILEKITERTKERIEEEKKIVPLEEVRRQAEEKELKIKSQYSNRHFGQTDYPLFARQRKRHLPKD